MSRGPGVSVRIRWTASSGVCSLCLCLRVPVRSVCAEFRECLLRVSHGFACPLPVFLYAVPLIFIFKFIYIAVVVSSTHCVCSVSARLEPVRGARVARANLVCLRPLVYLV